MTKQEENWEMMTILRLPWKDANDIEDANDRTFLLEKCNMIKDMHHSAMRDAAETEAKSNSALYATGGEQPDNIITP